MARPAERPIQFRLSGQAGTASCSTPIDVRLQPDLVGLDEGFTQFQVQELCNGILYDHSPGELAQAVQQFGRTELLWTPEVIADDVDRFATDQFSERMGGVVGLAVQEKRDRWTPDWTGCGPLVVEVDVDWERSSL